MTIFFAKFSKIRNPFPPIGRSHLQFFFRFASVFSLFYSIGKDLLAVSSSSLLHAPPPIQTLRNEEGKASRFAGNRSRVTQLPGRRSSGYPLPRVLDGSCGGWSLRGASWKAAFFSSLLQFKDIYIFWKIQRDESSICGTPLLPRPSLSLSLRGNALVECARWLIFHFDRPVFLLSIRWKETIPAGFDRRRSKPKVNSSRPLKKPIWSEIQWNVQHPHFTSVPRLAIELTQGKLFVISLNQVSPKNIQSHWKKRIGQINSMERINLVRNSSSKKWTWRKTHKNFFKKNARMDNTK